jgi:hypothetical protein
VSSGPGGYSSSAKALQQMMSAVATNNVSVNNNAISVRDSAGAGKVDPNAAPDLMAEMVKNEQRQKEVRTWTFQLILSPAIRQIRLIWNSLLSK